MTTKESEKPDESKDKKKSKGNENIFCSVERKNMKTKGGTIKSMLSGDIQSNAHTLLLSKSNEIKNFGQTATIYSLRQTEQYMA